MLVIEIHLPFFMLHIESGFIKVSLEIDLMFALVSSV